MLRDKIEGLQDDFTVYGSSKQPGNSASKMQGQIASFKLGKVPFHGNRRYCSWS